MGAPQGVHDRLRHNAVSARHVRERRVRHARVPESTQVRRQELCGSENQGDARTTQQESHKNDTRIVQKSHKNATIILQEWYKKRTRIVQVIYKNGTRIAQELYKNCKRIEK